jgi:hypothetical protein
MADTSPAPGAGGPGQKPKRLGLRDLAQFAGALLAALGVASLLNRLRKRSNMSESDPKPQRRVTGSRRSQPPAGPPQSDVEEEQQVTAEADADIEARRAIGHESSEIGAGRIFGIGAGIAVFGILLSVGLWGLFNFFASRPQAVQPQSALGSPQPTPPGPRLETDMVLGWQTLRATEQARLNTYGWVDQKAGVVRIPIDRAMDLIAQRGLPVQPGPARQYSGGDRTPNLDSSGGTEPTSAPQTNAPAGGAATATPTPAQ